MMNDECKQFINEKQFKNDLSNAIRERIIYTNDSSKFKNNSFKKYSKPVAKIDPFTMKTIKMYESCIAAEKDNNISEGGVSRAAKKGGKSGGFYWQYVNQEDKDTDRFKQ